MNSYCLLINTSATSGLAEQFPLEPGQEYLGSTPDSEGDPIHVFDMGELAKLTARQQRFFDGLRVDYEVVPSDQAPEVTPPPATSFPANPAIFACSKNVLIYADAWQAVEL